jgi:hypothetical protein
MVPSIKMRGMQHNGSTALPILVAEGAPLSANQAAEQQQQSQQQQDEQQRQHRQQNGEQQHQQQQGKQSDNENKYWRFWGLKISKEDLITITLALAISYGIRWCGVDDLRPRTAPRYRAEEHVCVP